MARALPFSASESGVYHIEVAPGSHVVINGFGLVSWHARTRGVKTVFPSKTSVAYTLSCQRGDRVEVREF